MENILHRNTLTIQDLSSPINDSDRLKQEGQE